MGAHVRVDGVSKAYGGGGAVRVEALAGVTFELSPGTFTALVGPSGCGKSTLLYLLGAVDTPDRGRILVDGDDLAALGERERDLYRLRRAATIFQTFNLLPTMTAAENVALPLLLAGATPVEARRRALSGLDEVHLAERERAYPYELSGGQIQRVAVARALVNAPALLLADEPTGNLDSRNGDDVLSLLSGLVHGRGITALMATHSAEAARHASRTLSLFDGRLVDGAP
jgi:putative ABC transport system ATP-binding protein